MLQVEAVLGKQSDVILGLGREALSGLSPEELFWRPAPTSWSVQQADGGWIADWIEPEPADLPPPTLAWQLWHCCWWLSMVIDHSFGFGRLTREAFTWAGPDAGFGAVAVLHDCWHEHCGRLAPEQWDDGALVRWPYSDARPFALLAGWVSMELTKNVAEMVRARGYYRSFRR